MPLTPGMLSDLSPPALSNRRYVQAHRICRLQSALHTNGISERALRFGMRTLHVIRYQLHCVGISGDDNAFRFPVRWLLASVPMTSSASYPSISKMGILKAAASSRALASWIANRRSRRSVLFIFLKHFLAEGGCLTVEGNGIIIRLKFV